MIDLIINILQIVTVIVYIIDILGIVEQVKEFIFKKINGKKINYIRKSFKPIDCSVCMSHHIILIYLLLNNQTIILALFLSTLASISSIIIKKILDKFLNIF
jgi:hypothetical protein